MEEDARRVPLPRALWVRLSGHVLRIWNRSSARNLFLKISCWRFACRDPVIYPTQSSRPFQIRTRPTCRSRTHRCPVYLSQTNPSKIPRGRKNCRLKRRRASLLARSARVLSLRVASPFVFRLSSWHGQVSAFSLAHGLASAVSLKLANDGEHRGFLAHRACGVSSQGVLCLVQWHPWYSRGNRARPAYI